MCCFFLAFLFFGPRVAALLWWIAQPVRWQLVFREWSGVWWIWPLLGVIFLPLTTLMYILTAPGGITGFDWLFLAITLAADLVSYAGSNARRDMLPAYRRY